MCRYLPVCVLDKTCIWGHGHKMAFSRTQWQLVLHPAAIMMKVTLELLTSVLKLSLAANTLLYESYAKCPGVFFSAQNSPVWHISMSAFYIAILQH